MGLVWFGEAVVVSMEVTDVPTPSSASPRTGLGAERTPQIYAEEQDTTAKPWRSAITTEPVLRSPAVSPQTSWRDVPPTVPWAQAVPKAGGQCTE